VKRKEKSTKTLGQIEKGEKIDSIRKSLRVVKKRDREVGEVGHVCQKEKKERRRWSSNPRCVPEGKGAPFGLIQRVGKGEFFFGGGEFLSLKTRTLQRRGSDQQRG